MNDIVYSYVIYFTILIMDNFLLKAINDFSNKFNEKDILYNINIDLVLDIATNIIRKLRNLPFELNCYDNGKFIYDNKRDKKIIFDPYTSKFKVNSNLLILLK